MRDRIVHHALYRLLYPYFNSKFIHDSYSCRQRKGVHRALNRFRTFARRVSRNHTRTCWVLKGDIRQFFASIDHRILKTILARHIPDQNIVWLLGQIIDSFQTSDRPGTGLPLGNVTSQLLVNVYLNEFDQFVKRVLKMKHYIRFADDFVILTTDKAWLLHLIPRLKQFLWNQLRLELHPEKLFVRTIASGVDFLGWVHFPHHRVLRTATKRRAWRGLRQHRAETTLNSYLGLLGHGNAHATAVEMKDFMADRGQSSQVSRSRGFSDSKES